MKNSIRIKALTLGLLLLFAQSQQYSVLSVLVFLLFGGIFYIQPIFRTSSLLFSSLSFAAIALLIPPQFAAVFERSGLSANPTLGFLLMSALFACLFYLVLGVKNLVLIRRRQWYYLLFLSLTYLALFLFFSADSGSGFWLKSLVFFVFSVGMLREFLRFQEIGLHRIHKLSVFVIGLIELECLWAVSFLPIGIANSAGFMTVVIYICSELAQRYMRGTLTARFIRLSFLFLFAVMFAIYFFSRWKL